MDIVFLCIIVERMADGLLLDTNVFALNVSEKNGGKDNLWNLVMA